MSGNRFDVVVVGAGLVGSCAALALARKGMSVALLERHAGNDDTGGDNDQYDLRVSAISPRSQAILRGLGVWQQLDSRRVCDYEQMHIWHQHGSASVHFDALQLARDSLGAIVENNHLKSRLIQACRQQPGISWFVPEQIEGLLENTQQGVSLRLSSGSCIEAGLLIAADGRQSPTRQLAGLQVRSGKYAQRALVANVTTEQAHRNTAWQRFLESGPLAFLPLANGQCSIVWSCDTALAQSLETYDEAEFCQALGEAFEFKLGRICASSARLGFELGWHSCDAWLEQRVLLIGDAAHSVHPLAGQGLNLGFSDVEALVDCLVAKQGGFERRHLRRYERARKSETWLATNSFSALKCFYGTANPAIAALRDGGMRLLDNNPLLKRELMQRAVDNIT